MLCHVEKPGRMARGSAERGGDKPRVLSVRKAPDRGCPCAPRLRSTRGENNHGEPRPRADALLARAAVHPHLPLADELHERSRHPRAASAGGADTNGHVTCLQIAARSFTQRMLAERAGTASSDATAWTHEERCRPRPRGVTASRRQEQSSKRPALDPGAGGEQCSTGQDSWGSLRFLGGG